MPTPATRRCEVVFRHGGIRFAVTGEADAEIVARLQASLPADVSASSDGSIPDVRYTIDRWRPSLTRSAPGHRIFRNGALRYLGRSPERVARWLRADIDDSVARCSSTRVVLAADVVAWRGRAILIMGHDRSGPSSLAAELVRLGATPCAHELALIDAEGRVIPDTSACDTSPAIALIISTTYRADASWSPRRLRGARAVLPIVASGSTRSIDPVRLLRLCALVAVTARTLQGPYGDATIAAPQILAALDECMDGRPRPAASLAQVPSMLAQARDALEPTGGHAIPVHAWRAPADGLHRDGTDPMQGR